MELSELENQVVELEIIKIKAIREKKYEVAARTRDKINALIESFRQTTDSFDVNALIERVASKTN